MNIVSVGDYKVGDGKKLLLMAGPCVLEGYERSLAIGQAVKKITDKLGINYIFKASYDKANRSSFKSFRTRSVANPSSGSLATKFAVAKRGSR